MVTVSTVVSDTPLLSLTNTPPLVVLLWTLNAAADVYVVRVGQGGDEAPSLSAASAAVFVDRYALTGGQASPVSTIALPTVAAGVHRPLTLPGNGVSEGFLKRSVDGRYLTLAGYTAEPESIDRIQQLGAPLLIKPATLAQLEQALARVTKSGLRPSSS